MHIALLRGINVGGKNMLPMRDLAGMFERAGCAGVRTYINSGNVVFEAGEAAAAKAVRAVGEMIEARFGFRAPIAVRTAGEMAAAAAACPYDAAAIYHKRLYVGFLVEQPEAARVKRLDPGRSPGDVFEVRGREVYMHLGGGAADTKLTAAYFDSVLGTVMTARNWRTVETLVGMCGGV